MTGAQVSRLGPPPGRDGQESPRESGHGRAGERPAPRATRLFLSDVSMFLSGRSYLEASGTRYISFFFVYFVFFFIFFFFFFCDISLFLL